MNIKYSVIVPAYNAETTIERCLNSILQDKRTDIEVLLINDGSTDVTGMLCKKISESDQRVRYYEKRNGGVSSARNLGLRLARGQYISFLDSDDFVSNCYFSVLDKNVKNTTQFILFGRQVFNGKEYKIIENDDFFSDDKETTIAWLCNAFRKQKLNSPWDKVYLNEIIKEHKLEFPEQLNIGEDKVFVIRYLMYIDNMKSIKDPIYIVSTENEMSLSRKVRIELCDSILVEHKLLYETIMAADLSWQYRTKYLEALSFSYYRSAYTVLSEIERYGFTAKQRKIAKKQICQKYSEMNLKKNSDTKTKIIALPINFHLISVIDLMVFWTKKLKKIYNRK